MVQSDAPRDLLPDALFDRLNAGKKIFLVDVRRPDEFAAGHIPGAVNVPVEEIAGRPGLLPADAAACIVAYCRSGRRSAAAAPTLLALGYSAVYNMPGGILAWQAAGYPIEI